ncbi:MAG: hypothetical protein KF752_17200 [Pirellulaceae bacterium]|nr:hypothetical protein [Pirellulaceae bacterium]
MRNEMNELRTTTVTLDSHAALACRIIRGQLVPHDYLQWLAKPSHNFIPQPTPHPEVLEAIENLIRPLKLEASTEEQRNWHSTSRNIAAICQFIAARRRVQEPSFVSQLLAAGLLPLYRSLATGRLHEGFSQTRRRLSETVILLALNDCLDLQKLLEQQVTPNVSPHEVIVQHLRLNLTCIDYLIATALPGYQVKKDRFQYSAAQSLRSFRETDKLPVNFQTPNWADPHVLWALSNELISSSSQLMLPRCWLDTPVPWNKISAHWQTLEQLLATTVNASPAGQLWPHSELTGFLNRDTQTASHQVESDRASSMTAPDTAQWESLSALREAEEVLAEELAQAALTGEEQSAQPIAPRLANHPVGVGQKTLSKSGSASRLASSHENAFSGLPKLLVGQVNGLDDPAFVTVVRRQVSICRSESRSVCLALILVLADNESENESLLEPQANGLSRWQQKLAHWLSEQPDVQQPLAFLTGTSQLALIALDSDRNQMTQVLRQGLIQVLAGAKKVAANDLSHVPIPARFHIGIASASTPGPNFDPQQLINSADRCLGVAQRLGKASIKSIEVF